MGEVINPTTDELGRRLVEILLRLPSLPASDLARIAERLVSDGRVSNAGALRQGLDCLRAIEGLVYEGIESRFKVEPPRNVLGQLLDPRDAPWGERTLRADSLGG